MPVHNSDISEILKEVADLLEIKGANQFRVRAYRNAARTISGLSRSVRDMLEDEEDLSDLSGIGKDMAGKIEEIAESGKLEQLEDLQDELPGELSEIMKLSGVGPKKVKAIYDELEISDLESLKKAAEEGRIKELEGFGEKTEKDILKKIKQRKADENVGRFMLAAAEELIAPFIDYLKKAKGIKDIDIAGSFRRRKETVGDIDILTAKKRGSKIMDRFIGYEDVDEVVSKGKTRSTVILRQGLQVDLRVVPAVGYGAALMYFTGSKAHNVALRKIAQKKKYKLNEYGLFKGDDRKAGKTENAVYKKLGLKYVEPEMREDRGEIEAARKEKLPKLITVEDIRGDLQMHTTASDGKSKLELMVEAAKEIGYDYIAITDHSKKVTVANGLDEKRVKKQIKDIDKLNEKIGDFRILKAIEVDILEDGSLDLDDEILKELDLVVCSIHYNFKLSKNKQTKRIQKAMDNKYFNIFAHPTGRRIGEREPYEIDLEAVMKHAKDNGCFLEINANPERLDLDDRHAKYAKEIGLKLSISTDAHSTNELNNMRYGVNQARRGWLEADDVINTRKWKELKKLLKRD